MYIPIMFQLHMCEYVSCLSRKVGENIQNLDLHLPTMGRSGLPLICQTSTTIEEIPSDPFLKLYCILLFHSFFLFSFMNERDMATTGACVEFNIII